MTCGERHGPPHTEKLLVCRKGAPAAEARQEHKAAPHVDRNALSARLRERDLPPVCGYDSETPDEITNEALYRACRAYGLGERFLAAVKDEGTFREWLDELPFEVAAATARLLKQAPRALRRVG